MQDFTLKIYKKFLHSLLANDYSFQTLENFIEHPNKEKIVILRHDVDRLSGNALKMAHMENTIGIKTSYFFRTVDQVFDETIIEKIVSLGHEIGYHYENLAEISRKKEDRRQPSTQSYAVPRRTEGGGRRAEVDWPPNSALRATHGRQTHTDVLFGRPDRIKMVIALRKKAKNPS